MINDSSKFNGDQLNNDYDKRSPSRLSICIYAKTKALAESLNEFLTGERYHCFDFTSSENFLEFANENKQVIDCLVIQNIESELGILEELYKQGTLLPVVIIEPKQSQNINVDRKLEQETIQEETEEGPLGVTQYLYHTGEVWLLSTQLQDISTAIERAIARFLKLAPKPNSTLSNPSESNQYGNIQKLLLLQQRRLAEKLKERLGYLGIYYKRNPQDFIRNLSPREKKRLLEDLTEEYREIILNYFTPKYPLNQTIDQLVNRAFFADVSVSQILEIHMDLMDQFAQQLKLEGRSEEILLDYRLALIDVIAHLCEMYRRSIPREDIPFEVFTSNE